MTVRRIVTSRSGGVSTGPYASFNLGDHVGDDPAAVAANRLRLAGAAGLEPDHLIWMEQIHGATVQVVDGPRTSPVEATDGLVTATPGIAVAALVADCVPILLADPANGVVAAVHAGRVGAAAGVVARAVAEFGAVDVALLNVGQGPDMAMAEVDVAEVARVMSVNYDVTVNYLVPLIAQLRRQGGGLIAQTNSLAGLMGIPRQGPYSAAKAAVRILIDAARVELAPEGVRFTSLYPGFVATARVSADGLPKPFQISEKQAARHVVRALRREPADASFPWTTSALVRLLRALPARVSGRLLRKLAR